MVLRRLTDKQSTANFLLQVLWTFSIYLEAVAILPQLVLMQRTQNLDNLTANYVALLGCVFFGRGRLAAVVHGYSISCLLVSIVAMLRLLSPPSLLRPPRPPAQRVPRPVHHQLDLPLLHGAALPAVAGLDQRRGADGAVRGCAGWRRRGSGRVCKPVGLGLRQAALAEGASWGADNSCG